MLTALMLAVALQASSVPPTRPPATAPLAPGTTYDPAIPTAVSVLGHDFGEAITPPAGIEAYLRALAKAAPDRVRLIEYGRSWEGRPLHVAVIGSTERLANLDRLTAALRKLADPRTLAAGEGERLVASLPVVVWLMHAVHGNEISSSDAALAEAYHLLAARGDAVVDAIVRDAVVVIDPLQNPDGRARFVVQNLLGAAARPDPEPQAAEHDEPWPGGRSNHYLFDMNRDWFAQSQPETRGRTKLYLEWYPHVVVDLHEMGGNSTYYFAPPAEPLNPHITRAQAGWFETFGRAIAGRFDERGFAYFNREEYDSFYPGYGESWPILQGAIGMTYEQASARGLVWRRNDGGLLTYRDGVLHHFTAAISTAFTAASNRERLLRDFLEYRQTAIREAERGAREYVLPPGHDPSRADRLARLLASQGFEVRRADEPFKLGGRELPAGTILVPLAQPGGRLLRNLMEAQVPQPTSFIEEQDRRRKQRLSDQIYDVTAWSLPLAFDVELLTSDRPVTVKASPAQGLEPPGTGGAGGPSAPQALPAAKIGYLLPWGSGTAATVAQALDAGIRVRVINGAFTLGGRSFPRGTALVRMSDNDAAVAKTLGALASRNGSDVVPIDTAFVEQGTSLGSNDVVALKPPHVLLAWDTPTSTLSAGWARYVLERRFGQPATAVRVGSLARVDFRRFDVIVLPSGSYALAPDSVGRLKEWMRGGGTLITLGDASRWAARDNVALLETTTELRGGRPDVEPTDKDQKKDEPPKRPFEYEPAIQPDREPPENTPGALLRVQLDAEHWLTAGTDGEVQALVEGRRVFTPIKLDKGRNVGVYQRKDRLVASGLVWDEAGDQLAQKAFLLDQPVGDGRLIAFAEDPNFRAFTEATELLFVNAVVLGPAF